MNTKKINEGNTPKGGKDNTRVVLTTAGAVAVGTAAGVAGSTILRDNENPQDAEEEKENHAEEQAQNEQQNGEQQSELAQAKQENQTTSQPANASGTQTAGNGNNTAGNGNQGGGHANPDYTNGGDVEAEALAVAERLVQSDEIDAHDLDDLANVNFEESDILYMENGNEVPVAAVTTPDGGQYLLADVNGDRIYDVVYDTEGNLVAGVQAGLNTNDAQLAMDENGGYIPITDDDPVFNDEDAELDILALDDTDHGVDGVMEEIDDVIDDLFADDEEEIDIDDPDIGTALALDDLEEAELTDV